MLGIISQFVRRYRLDRVLRKLNQADTFRRIQGTKLSAGDVEALRRREATAHRRQEWRDNAHIINLHESAPDSAQGRMFLASLTAADIHCLAGEIHYDGRYDEDWALAFATHPKCDLGTGWLLFLGKGVPKMSQSSFEADEGNEPAGKHLDVFAQRQNIIADRFRTGGYASRDYSPQDPERIKRCRRDIRTALAGGEALRWDIPDDAFRGLKGLDAKSRYEKSGDDVFLDFETWLDNAHPAKQEAGLT